MPWPSGDKVTEHHRKRDTSGALCKALFGVSTPNDMEIKLAEFVPDSRNVTVSFSRVVHVKATLIFVFRQLDPVSISYRREPQVNAKANITPDTEDPDKAMAWRRPNLILFGFVKNTDNIFCLNTDNLGKKSALPTRSFLKSIYI